MDIYDSELHEKVIDQMRRERIQDFSEEEIERAFADFDLPERQYLEIIDVLITRGLTIDDIYRQPSQEHEIDIDY